MSIHAIVLSEANAEVSERIAVQYPQHYALNNTFFLVRSDKITEKVAIDVGIKGDARIEDALGVVFKLNGTYAGYASRALWDWLTIEE